MKQLRVVVIDDSEIDRYILKRQLKSAGIVNVEQQNNAKDALEYFQLLSAENTQNAPNLIILDVNMPRMSGLEFLEATSEMFTTGFLSECAVVMYSGSEDQEEQAQALAFKAVKGFLLKGSTPQQVEQLLASLVPI